MNESWKNFLMQHGAAFSADAHDGPVTRFDEPADEIRATASGDVIADLSHVAILSARGEDAQAFLQGQFSNDIRLVTDTLSQLSAYCTPKGRMLTLFRILQRGDDYLLQLPAALRDDILKRLRMYVLRAKVQLENSESLAGMGISGAGITTALQQITGSLPDTTDECVTYNDILMTRLPGPQPRIQLIGEATALSDIWTTLAPHAAPVGTFAWRWLDIMAGLPSVLPATSEAFVPQMANLELLNGVNFKKGCYPGQEIVARMHYLGRLKQRMYRFHVKDSGQTPRPGDPVYAPDFADQAAGTVVDAQPSPRDGYDLLVIAQISSVEHGEIHLATQDGPRLSQHELPYPIPVVKTSTN